MHPITTYAEALSAIWHRSGYDRGFISNPFAGDDAAKLGLRRTRALLDTTGHTSLPYNIVHVAGSKGKGSTCVVIDAILRAAGLRTGRYLSPHLHSFRERFVVNDTMISEDDFITLARDFVTAAEAIESSYPELGTVTAFELSTAMALAWFARSGVDVAVVEVGMGGELDSTNIVDPSVSVITTLDYEHTAVLGSTMPEIAGNKAGIIKPHRPVLTAIQPDNAHDVIVHRAGEMNAPLYIAGQHWEISGHDRDFSFDGFGVELTHLRLGLVGEHQVANAGLAIAAALTLAQTDSAITITPDSIRSGVDSACLPGRFELVEMETGPTFVIDGAHTAASAQALVRSVQNRFPDTEIALVIGILQDKDANAILSPLTALRAAWIAVSPDNPRALPVRDLALKIAELGLTAMPAASVADGITAATQSGAPLVIITGSLTTAAEARIALGLASDVDPR